MHWLVMRPVMRWGLFLLVHAISIPLIYGMGKARGKQLVQASKPGIILPEPGE